MGKNEIVLFESRDGVVSLPVSVEDDTVWLNILQMAALFSKDRSVILRHVHNAINEGEVDPKVTCAKFAQVTPHGAVEGKTRTQIIDTAPSRDSNSTISFLLITSSSLGFLCDFPPAWVTNILDHFQAKRRVRYQIAVQNASKKRIFCPAHRHPFRMMQWEKPITAR